MPSSPAPRDPGPTPGAGHEEHTGPIGGTPAGYGTAYDPEPTRILPPPSPGTPEQPAPSAPQRRTGALSAAVLAGALVVGGLGGVGGAVAYDALNGSDSASTTSGNGDLGASGGSTKDAASVTGGVSGVAAKVLPSVVQVNVVGASSAGTGSGIILTTDGLILTNNHVASAVSGGKISVRFNDGSTKSASVVGTDPVTDLALIKADNASGLTAADIGRSSALSIGQQVVAIGSPEGLSATVTSGIVSALNRPVSIDTSQQDGSGGINPFGQQGQSPSKTTTYPAIQTDAAINEGNSGGPLVNMSGQVVGVNSAIKTAQGSSGSIGIGFSIPLDEALPIINQLKNKQTPTHARLGISVSDSSADKVIANGALIKSVEKGGAGDSVGLKSGDVITKVDDEQIDSSNDLVATIRGHRPDEKVTLTVLRDGKTLSIAATLGSDENATSS